MTRENKNMDKEEKPTAISKLIEYLEEAKDLYGGHTWLKSRGDFDTALSLAKQVEYETANPTKTMTKDKQPQERAEEIPVVCGHTGSVGVCEECRKSITQPQENNCPEPQEKEIKKLLNKFNQSNEPWEDFFAREIPILLQKEREKMAHPTKDGYCCACSYDIAGFEEKLQTAKKDHEILVNTILETQKKQIIELVNFINTL